MYKAGFIKKKVASIFLQTIEAAREVRKSRANYPKDYPSESVHITFSSISTSIVPCSIRKKECPESFW